MATEKFAEPGWMTTDVEPAGTNPGLTIIEPADDQDARSKVRRVAAAARTKASAGTSRLRTETPVRTRQAGHAVRRNPVPVAATVLTALGAIAVVVIRRRSAARAAAAQSGPLAFLRRR